MNDTLLNAVLLGTLAQSALVISGLLVYQFKFSDRVIGVLAGFGVGALIEAISFDLDRGGQRPQQSAVRRWMLLGAAVFLLGDAFVEKRFGGEGGGSAMGIVVGSIVDGVPESAIFGIQVATAFPISAGFLMAVFVSNFPQALAPSADLAKGGWKMGKLVGMWALVLAACGVASGLGYVLAGSFSA